MADPKSESPPQPIVLAVVVSPGISDYLADTLRGLAGQRTAPDAVLVVDVTPAEDPGHVRTSSLRTLAQECGLALEMVRIAHAPEAGTFGAGVRDGLRQLADQGNGGAALSCAPWIWLLHDDSAPEPSALAELLRGARSGPTVAITGAKQRDWFAPEHLLELGVTVSRSGRRYVGLEDGELDQGQHDGRSDVYAVGLAGALVRKEVWNELDGTDPALGPFGDGLDLSRRARLAGYRVIVAPGAVVRHARAGYLGLRSAAARHRKTAAKPDPRRSFRARRAALLYARLVEVRAWALPFLPLLIAIQAMLRSVARVATKEFRLAGDEVAAAASALTRPRTVYQARARISRQGVVPRSQLRALRASARQVWQVGHDRRLQSAAARRGLLARSELELAERAELAGRRRWTVWILATALTGVAALVFAPLLSVGALTGGALLPLTSELGALWERAVGAWAPTGDGHPGPADPFLFVLVAVTALAGGSARTGVTVLVLGAIPLAGLGAWFAAGAATRSVRLRAWATVVWAFAPPLVLATGQGRLGPVVAHLALPWVALGIARALGVQRRDELVDVPVAVTPERGGSVAAAAGAGLALAVAAAASPVLLPASLVLLPLLAVVAERRRGMLALVAVPPVALLAPLVLEAISDVPAGSWRVLLADPGVLLASSPGPAYHALLTWPAGPLSWPLLDEPAAGLAPLVASGLLVLGALVALLRRGRLGAVRAGWLLVAVGLAAAVGVTRVDVGVGSGAPGGTTVAEVVRGWAGTGTSVLVLGLLVVVTCAADGLIGRLASSSFGWRHVGAAALVVLLVLGPAANAVAWVWQVLDVRGTDGPSEIMALTGRGPRPVPALGAELQKPPQAARVLSLDPVDDELVVGLWRSEGEQLDERSVVASARTVTGPPGSVDVVPVDEADAELAELAAAIAVGVAEDPSAELARHAVGVVLVPPGSSDARDRLVAQIDSTAGLERVTENETGTVWRVAPAEGGGLIARVRVVRPDGTVQGLVPTSGALARGQIEAGEPGRLVVLAERADDGWRAWLDGRPLRARTVGWQQAFALPPGGGEVTIAYFSWPETLIHTGQAVVLGLFALLAIPVRRRRAGVG